MSRPSAYPSPPYVHPDNPDFLHTQHLYASAWHIIDRPPPPTLREILSAYKSKGDGDRDMLLAMLNAKSAEDQRIAALANLHQKIIELQPHVSRPHIHDHGAYLYPMVSPLQYPYPPPPPPPHPLPLSRDSRSVSPRDYPLRNVETSPMASNANTLAATPNTNSTSNSRKRARTSHSPSPPLKKRHSGQSSKSTELPPSPPFSSPGGTTLGPPELAGSHPSSRDAMAIGSLLTSDKQDEEAEWPSRTSSERDRDGHQRSSKTST